MATAVDIGTLIVRTPGTVGGRPRIDGTRIRVSDVAISWNKGHSAEEMVDEIYPGVTLAQAYAALAYYYANRAEIDREILEYELTGCEGEAASLRAGDGPPWLTDEQRRGQIADLGRTAALLRSRLE